MRSQPPYAYKPVPDHVYTPSLPPLPPAQLCFNYLTFYPVSAMPDLDYCVADTRKNITTCATRTQLARMTAVGANDTVQLQVDSLVVVLVGLGWGWGWWSRR